MRPRCWYRASKKSIQEDKTRPRARWTEREREKETDRERERDHYREKETDRERKRGIERYRERRMVDRDEEKGWK